jgi:protein-disulfide isomerase
MRPNTRSRLVLLSLLCAPLGCGRRGDVEAAAASVTPPAQTAPSAQVVAEVDGRRITLAELDERLRTKLAPLEQQIYDARAEGLRDMIGEVLLEKEAKSRGLSVEAVLAAEVDEKVPPPSQEQIAQVYGANRERLVGMPQDQAYAQIESAIRGQSQATRRREFRQELIKKAAVQTSLTPPRVSVTVPKDAPALGPADAKITIVAFLDYQCPYCHRSQAAVERLMQEHKGKVRLVHQDFPLDIHERAFAASEAARCAGDQGKFWDYHRSLLTAQGSFDGPDLKARAATLGLDKAAFATCMSSKRHDAEIHAGLEMGQKLGVNSTPTFFINGRRLIGARPYEDFEAIVVDEGV